MRHPLLAGGRVHAGDREAVHLRRRERERDVDEADAPAHAPEAIPEGGRPPVAPVDHAQVVAAVVALDEVPDPVPPRVDAGDHRGPRVRRQRVRRRAQDRTGARLEDAGDVGQVAGFDERVDHVEGRGVEADHGELRGTNGGEVYERARMSRDAALLLPFRLLADQLRRRGVRGTWRRLVRMVKSRSAQRKRSQADRVYDEEAGVDTAAWVRVPDLDTRARTGSTRSGTSRRTSRSSDR